MVGLKVDGLIVDGLKVDGSKEDGPKSIRSKWRKKDGLEPFKTSHFWADCSLSRDRSFQKPPNTIFEPPIIWLSIFRPSILDLRRNRFTKLKLNFMIWVWWDRWFGKGDAKRIEDKKKSEILVPEIVNALTLRAVWLNTSAYRFPRRWHFF